MKNKSKYKQSTIKNVKFIDSETLYNKFIDPNSILVKIHDSIDFSFINELCDPIYSESGQHAYSPELVFRVIFIQYMKNLVNDNEVIRQCKTNMEYRYFCNLSIDDDLFDDCKLSRFRKELGPERFKEIFNMIVEKVQNAGLISDQDTQYMDSFLFLADVKLISINSLLSKAIQELLRKAKEQDFEVDEDKKQRDYELTEEQQKNRFVFLIKKAQELITLMKEREDLSQDAKKSLELLQRIVKERAEINGEEIRKKKTKEEKDKIVNLSDVDARMMGKRKTPIVPSYKSHVSMTEKGFITYTDVTLATVYDGHQEEKIIRDLKSRNFQVPKGVGDTHYGDMNLRERMADEGTQIVAPYRQSQVINSCCREDVMIEAFAYNHTQEYKENIRIRAHIEPKQGEMKNFHGMHRAKYRGLKRVRIQNYSISD